MPRTPNLELPLPPGSPLPPETRRERIYRLGSSTNVSTFAQQQQQRTRGDSVYQTDSNLPSPTDGLTASGLTERTSLNGGDLAQSYGTLPPRRPVHKDSYQSFGEQRHTLNLNFPTILRRSNSIAIGQQQLGYSPSTLRHLGSPFARLSSRPISAYDPPLNAKDREDDGGDAKINGIRVWYSSFTSIDWLHDAIKDSLRFSRLRKRKSFRAKVRLYFDKSLGWVIVTIVGFLTAVVAFLVVRSEQLLFDWKEGYCADGWSKSKRFCCPAEQGGSKMASPFVTRAEEELCSAWRPWSQVLSSKHGFQEDGVEYASYTAIAVRTCQLTL